MKYFFHCTSCSVVAGEAGGKGGRGEHGKRGGGRGEQGLQLCKCGESILGEGSEAAEERTAKWKER